MRRIQFYWAYLGSVRKCLVAGCFVMSNMAWLPVRWRAFLFFLIPNWSWQTWLFIGTILLCAFILEEAHYRHLVLEAEKESSKQPEQTFLVPILASVLIAVFWVGSVALQTHRLSKAQPSVAPEPVVKTEPSPDNTSTPQPKPAPLKPLHVKKPKPTPVVPEPPTPSTTAATPTTVTPAASTYNAPGGIIVPNNQGLVTNPTVNNFGPPPAHLSHTEEIISALPTSGEGLKIMKVHITTDRSVPGAIIGLVFSGPIEPISGREDPPQLQGSGSSQMSWGTLQGNNGAIPNSLAVAVNIPAAFLPGEELIVTVKSKTDVQVIGVGVVH